MASVARSLIFAGAAWAAEPTACPVSLASFFVGPSALLSASVARSLSLAATAWRASFARDSDWLDRVVDGLRDCARRPLALLGCDRDRRWEALACCDLDERVALGRAGVLARVLLGAAALADWTRVARDAVPLADPLPEGADERLSAACLERELELDDRERVGAPGASFLSAGPAEPEAPSVSSCLRLANSMMVVRPLWWRS